MLMLEAMKKAGMITSRPRGATSGCETAGTAQQTDCLPVGSILPQAALAAGIDEEAGSVPARKTGQQEHVVQERRQSLGQGRHIGQRRRVENLLGLRQLTAVGKLVGT